MNCTRVEKLLPLYAGGDLPPRVAEAASAHLVDCEACRRLAAEYEQSRSWLVSAAAPEFDEQFFADLRGAVRREVALERALPEPRSGFALLIGWKPLAATAALLLGGLLTYRSLEWQRPSAAKDEQVVRERADEPGKPNSRSETATRQARPRQAQTQTIRRRPRRTPPTEFAQPAPNLIVQEPRAVSGESEAAAQADSGAPPEALRIEIQTADPNIRIIWFVPQETTATAARAGAETR
jgi:hypothetical protein